MEPGESHGSGVIGHREARRRGTFASVDDEKRTGGIGGGAGPLQVRPIGVVRSPFHEKVEAPRQGVVAGAGTAELWLDPSLAHAVEDLDGFERIWVVFWFHLAEGFAPKVLPPRSSRRRGVLATRSPHRPNPIGLTAARLLERAGTLLRVDEVDLLDGTPILDVKPYLPYADAFPAARMGWLDEEARAAGAPPASAPAERPRDPLEPWGLAFTAEAERALSWLEARGVPLRAGLVRQLSLGPQVHPYRRIRSDGAGLRVAVKEWRARFTVEGRTLLVGQIFSGYRAKELAEGDAPPLPLHREFSLQFGFPPPAPQR